MNRVAEYGIAAHWRYKEGTTGPQTEFDRKLGWIKEVMDVQGDLKDSLEFIDTLKTSGIKSKTKFLYIKTNTIVETMDGNNTISWKNPLNGGFFQSK